MLLEPGLHCNRMSTPPFVYHKLLRNVFHFEWILLSLCITQEFLSWKYVPADPSAPSLIVSLIFLVIVAVLSFFPPLQHRYWDRLCFLFLEIILLTGATAAGLSRFVFPLFMVVIAKACLMLDRRGLLITGFAAFCAQLVWAAYKVVITNPTLLQHGWSVGAIITTLASSLVMIYAAVMVMVLVALLTLSLVSEQQSRLEAERLAKEVEALATEVERSRIAREIHDSLGHTLTTLNVQLDVLKLFRRDDPARAEEALRLAKELATQSLTDVRLAVQSIRSPNFSLKDALEALVRDMRQSQDLDVRLNMDVPDLPPAVSFQLYRVIQECLTNVLKHAQASEVTIEIVGQDGTVNVDVSDNGRGLQDQAGGGFGIRGMQERVQNLSGSFAIRARHDHGTQVQVVIPL